MVGEEFKLHAPGGALVLLLAEATPRPQLPHSREPFTLIFREASGALFPQGTYDLEHPALGTFPLFVVPIGPDGAGMRYEAVFG